MIFGLLLRNKLLNLKDEILEVVFDEEKKDYEEHI